MLNMKSSQCDRVSVLMRVSSSPRFLDISKLASTATRSDGLESETHHRFGSRASQTKHLDDVAYVSRPESLSFQAVSARAELK
ncbi:hypothetical protein HUJ04_013459 [Dendroctonus ponderosae]|nr:hypothetical protein HUJ04_013459 [Dendroctonus ponderosae]KAH1006158.1 hypothetical protein HUJ05_006922 [Dendroctonus ponderosae]